MELRYKGSFSHDIAIHNRALLDSVRDAILNVKGAKDSSQIHHLRKLKNYHVHYRIKIAGNYRIGIIIRKNIVWFVRFGHRSNFYKKFP